MSRHSRDVLRVAGKACDECHKATLRDDAVMCAGYRGHAERGHDPRTKLLLHLGRELGRVQVVDPVTGQRVDEGSE